MPASIAGMPISVWNMPVASPASMPARNAAPIATHTLQPPMISTAATAPPVAMLPSTVRSDTSKMR